MQTQTSRKVKRFRTDKGTEYLNCQVEQSFNEHGIHREITVPPNSESNGRAEILNETLLNTQ